MDWLEIILKALPIIGTILSVVVFIFMMMAGAKFLSKREGEKLKSEIDGLKSRFVAAEAALENVPRVDAMHELSLSIERMNGTIKGMLAQLVSMEKFSKLTTATMQRQEEFLLNLKGK